MATTDISLPPKNIFPVERNGHKPTVLPTSFLLENFCKGLARSDSRSVTSAAKEIARLRQHMVVNVLAIGSLLSKLRSGIGSERFSVFMKIVLPTLGISRSSGYRWLALAESLVLIFPNPHVREHLMALTDGRGIVTTPTNDGKRDSLKVTLTPAAEEALRNLPPAPKHPQKRADCEEWVFCFIKATAILRTRNRSDRNQAKDQGGILRMFGRFAKRYGTQAAEDLCGLLDKALNRIVEKSWDQKRGIEGAPGRT